MTNNLLAGSIIGVDRPPSILRQHMLVYELDTVTTVVTFAKQVATDLDYILPRCASRTAVLSDM